jgi:hypothetical protein
MLNQKVTSLLKNWPWCKNTFPFFFSYQRQKKTKKDTDTNANFCGRYNMEILLNILEYPATNVVDAVIENNF